MFNDVDSPTDQFRHVCQPLDDAEDTLETMQRVIALAHWADPSHLPLYPEHRRAEILKRHWPFMRFRRQARRIPMQRT